MIVASTSALSTPRVWNVGVSSTASPSRSRMMRIESTSTVDRTCGLCVVSTNRAGHRAYARLEVIQDCRDI